MRAESSARRGMTLVELMVAIVVGGIALGGVAAIADGMHTVARAARAGEAERDRRWAGERMLRQLLLQAELEPPGMVAFAGDRAGLRVATWCDTPAGWQERCVAALTIREGEVSVSGAADDRVLLDLEGPREFRYLLTAADGGRWSDRWPAAATPPVAVALVGRDTLIFRIGGRG